MTTPSNQSPSPAKSLGSADVASPEQRGDAERPDRGIVAAMLKWGSVFSLAIAGSIRFVIEHYAHSAALFAAACFFLLVWREMDGGKESNV